ncbi:MAG: hypothetical protein HKN27_01670 [Silicimonas sp.]|nr:hypothetical protein [Silicimonas sp.]
MMRTPFLDNERGAITVLGLFLFIVSMMVGGLALDVSNAVKARTQLQMTADTAGHAALVWRFYNDADSAKDKALELAAKSMPSSYYGSVLERQDITFGHWDRASETFTPDPASQEAVLVSTRRLAENNNGVGTYLLKLVGVDAWDLNTDAVWELGVPRCLKEGYVAEDVISLQSDNTFKSGFCVHSNTGLNFANHNTFEADVKISVPDIATDVDATFSTNHGLEEALYENYYALNIPQRIQKIRDGITDPASEYWRDFVTSAAITDVDYKSQLTPENLAPGGIYEMTCPAPTTKIRMPAGTVLENIVLLTNCQIIIGQDSKLQNLTIINSNTSASSISGASGIDFGLNDNCAPGGATQIVSMGGLSFPTQVSIYDSQLLANGDISFTSHADGIKGASIVSGGKIDTNSHITMGFCGASENFKFEFVRLAM